MGERERISNEIAIKNYNAAIVCTQMAKPELAQCYTHRHALAPPSPPPQTQASIATRQKRIVLLTNPGFIWSREGFSLSTTPFPAPIKQNTSLKRPLLPLSE